MLQKDTDRAGERISAALESLINWLGIFKKNKANAYPYTCRKAIESTEVFSQRKQVIGLDNINDQ
ncbi:hypothetical protein DXN04_28275 [Chitinophaga silvisoli]|uniref:Uncharacterized protein n=1 Tax=Chitinophaga silvisoli TaxID=2291814 RepID=A0A3E1NUN3_9BACT|nr:hypothetical protein DXN04_28275 [Chitinophaga silvisoli]